MEQRLELSDVSLSFNGDLILDEISFSATNGINCILGPNGSGKTVTNKAISLIYPVDSGTIKWEDQVINPWNSKESKLKMGRTIGMLWQQPYFLNRSARYNVELPLKLREISKETRKKEGTKWLKEVELLEFENKKPQKMSLGQQQKLSLARALIADPKILILDEPTSSLDPTNKKWFENYLLTNIDDGSKIIIWNSHDLFQVKRVAKFVSILINGKIMESGIKSSVMENPSNETVIKFLSGELF